MTRDEAAKIIRNINYPDDADNHSAWSERMIDTFVALGMVKLDEPKSRDEKMRDVMSAAFGMHLSMRELDRLDAALVKAGLEIIEKRAPTYCTVDGPQWCKERAKGSRCPDCPLEYRFNVRTAQ